MKIEEYECVKIKRRAQERIYEETRDLTPEELLAYYDRSFEQLRALQAKLRAQNSPTPSAPSRPT